PDHQGCCGGGSRQGADHRPRRTPGRGVTGDHDAGARCPRFATGASMNKIEVRYIGPRDQWRDHLYGSGLHFTKDQVRAVPYLLGRRLLRHTDLFVVHEPGDAATSANTDSTVDQHADLLSAGQPAAQDNGQGDATGAEGEASDDTD